jgi:hypothetical protein
MLEARAASDGTITTQVYVDGIHLLQRCEAPPSPPPLANDFYLCIGYIQGLMDELAWQKKLMITADLLVAGSTSRFPCPPDRATPEQLRLVIVKYLRGHSEKLHLPASMLAHEALVNAFPCQQ